MLHGDLNMLRCFAGTGVRTVILSSDPEDPCFFSRHCGQRRLIADAAVDPTGALADLRELGKLVPGRPVFFYGDDAMLLLVSRHRKELGDRFRFLLPAATLVEALVDKLRFAALARELSLPVPRTVTSTEHRTGAEIAAELPLPVILKPFCHLGWRTSPAVLGLGAGPLKALIARDGDELQRMVGQRMASFSPDFVAQEFIPGGEEHVYSFHAYLDAERRPLGHYVGRKIRTYPRRAGVSTYLELTVDPELTRIGFEVLARLGLAGVVKLDFKRDPDTGRFYLLEVNPRFNLWNHLGAAAGVNLPWLAYRDLAGARGDAGAAGARGGALALARRRSPRPRPIGGSGGRDLAGGVAGVAARPQGLRRLRLGRRLALRHERVARARRPRPGAALRYAILADVHGNLEALSAVLAAAAAEGAERFACAGDLVGYHADPDACIERLRAVAAVCVAGNHDRVAAGLAEPEGFGAAAGRAALWTRSRLSPRSRAFLAGLPVHRVVDGRFLLCHGALHPAPNADLHLSSHARVARSIEALRDGPWGVGLAFFGHTHRAAVHEARGGACRSREGVMAELSLSVPGALYLVNSGQRASGSRATAIPARRSRSSTPAATARRAARGRCASGASPSTSRPASRRRRAPASTPRRGRSGASAPRCGGLG